MNQVFGCPSCQQPFQVAAEQAGQIVQCPGCAQPVEIPSDAFATAPPADPEPEIFSCPNCQGQFGITPEMHGQQVGCPHCNTSVLVEDARSRDEPLDPPVIKTKSKKKPTPPPIPREQSPASDERWKSPAPSKESPDLYAPGFTNKSKSQPAAEPSAKSKTPIKPKRHTDKATPKQSQPTSTTSPQETASQKELVPSPGKRNRKPRFKDKPVASTATPTPPKQKPVPPVDQSPVTAEEVPNRPSQSAKQNSTPTPVKSDGSGSSDSVEDKSNDALLPSDQPESIKHLLPPLFDVLDPKRMRGKTGNEQFKVMLPDGKGGTQQVDQRVIRVQHDGEQVSLVAMTQKEKQRRRLIQNVVAILIGIAVLAIAFTLLR